MAKNQLTSKELKSPDVIETFLYHAADHLFRNKKLYTIIIIAFFAALLIAFGIYEWMKIAENSRNEAFFKIEKIVNSEDSEKQKADQALPLLDQFLKDYSGTNTALRGHFYKGTLLSQDESKIEEAISQFQVVIDDSPKKSSINYLANIYLSNLLGKQGKLDDAITRLEQLDSEHMPDIRLMELAEAYILKGDKSSAKNTLEVIVKDYQDSQYRTQAEKLLETL